VAFGPDNFVAAKEAGKFLGEYAVEQGWDPNETQLVLIWTSDVPVHQARAEGATEGVQEVFAIPAENIHNVNTETVGDEYDNMKAWITAHPDAQNVLCFGHSDLPGVNCALALEDEGFRGRSASASLGASDEALVDLRDRTAEESVFIGTISYFPERYGTYLVPIIVDLLEGKEVPERIIPAVAPVTRENVMELYPGN
jgi:ribose transport system substrate-binding protein